MTDKFEWVASTYPQHPIPSLYTHPSSSSMMMAPQPQGHYISYGQYCLPYKQPVQQYQYSNYATGYYNQYQQSVASGMIWYPLYQHQTPMIQQQVTSPLPKRVGKRITIRDPNQGGRDITHEILSGLYRESKSVAVASAPLQKHEDPSPTSSSLPAPSVLNGSVDVPVAEEEICTDLVNVEQNDSEMLPLNSLGSVVEVLPESASVSNVVESVVSLTVSPSPPPDIPDLSSPSGSVESGKDVEHNTIPAELICSGLKEEKSKDAEISVSNSTCIEVPNEIKSFATGKADNEDKPTLVPSDTNLSDDEELKIRRVKTMIDFTVERATTEPKSAVMYANFCYELKDEVSTMKKMLLSRCQEELRKERKHDMALAKKQKELNDAKKEKVWQNLKKDLEEEKIRSFQCSLLNMEFIAELFKREMLPKSFINSWIEQKLVVNPSEENLECLCRLLSMAGKDLHDENDTYLMDLYFCAINKIIQQKKLSSRICSMLQSIVELRQNNWVPKRKIRDTKTINVDSSIKRGKRAIKKQDDGPMTVTIRNQTDDTSRPSKINKPGAANHNQLDVPARKSSWGNWGNRGTKGSRDRSSTEENGSAYIRTKFC
ncbi:eukaryotic translation initiation factor 4 gamma 1-like [Trichomycterus rosablanca]|uniref:eukaryotic translation initiation factor 4 gamma 1-like n=1 Tax=Trichomycterus rosablanca TaxID=2290929 RepID=UPI002F35E476